MTVSVAIAGGVGILGLADLSRAPTARFVPPASADTKPAQPPAKRTIELLCGTRPASLGSVFGTLELGRIVDRLPTPSASGVTIELMTTGRRIDAVEITIPNDPGWAGCYQFAEQLHQRWGAAAQPDRWPETWDDVARDRVATFTQSFDHCTLTFSHHVSKERWLNQTRSSLVPIWAIGKPVAELEEALALPHSADPDKLVWEDRSLGDRFDNVELTAYLKAGRVVGIFVKPPFGNDVADLLWERLKALYGAPAQVTSHEDAIEVRWRRAPGITVGKYWGQAAMAPRVVVPGQPAVPATPRVAKADDGVLLDILFGVSSP